MWKYPANHWLRGTALFLGYPLRHRNIGALHMDRQERNLPVVAALLEIGRLFNKVGGKTKMRGAMNFDEATEELRSFVLIEDIAREMGITSPDVRRMRRPPHGSDMAPAPEGWEEHIAHLARQQASRLLKLADHLMLPRSQGNNALPG